jgi:hypothetical protein
MRHHFGSWLVRNRLTRGLKCSAARYLARPFAHKDSRRMVIFHHPSRISYSQIYPFLLHQKEIWDRYGVEIRCHPFQDLQAGKIGYLAQADIVLLQPWFTVDPHEVRAACDQIGRHSPQAELSFLDSYAHNDLRLARYLPDTFRFYLKKSLFNTISVGSWNKFGIRFLVCPNQIIEGVYHRSNCFLGERLADRFPD